MYLSHFLLPVPSFITSLSPSKYVVFAQKVILTGFRTSKLALEEIDEQFGDQIIDHTAVRNMSKDVKEHVENVQTKR
jgi:hypothetical protein